MKVRVALLSAALAVAFAGFASWLYLRALLAPSLREAHALLADESAGAARVSDQLRDVVYRVERRAGEAGVPGVIVERVARRLASVDRHGGTEIGWQVRKRALQSALLWQLTEGEVLTLYFRLLPYEGGIGLDPASRHYFAKPASDLSPQEVVRLLAIARAPDRFSPSVHPDALSRMEARLWAAYESGGGTP